MLPVFNGCKVQQSSTKKLKVWRWLSCNNDCDVASVFL